MSRRNRPARSGAGRGLPEDPRAAGAGFEEHFAAGLLCDTLERHGLTPTRGAYDLKAASQCDIGEDRPVVAILSEYDALPGLEDECAIGTPAEEDGGGKAVLPGRGAFERVEAAMMVHPTTVDLESTPTSR